MRINWQGEIVCIVSRSGYSANPYRVERQRETRSDRYKRIAFCVPLITKKIEASILTLEKLSANRTMGKGDASNLFGFDSA